MIGKLKVPQSRPAMLHMPSTSATLVWRDAINAKLLQGCTTGGVVPTRLIRRRREHWIPLQPIHYVHFRDSFSPILLLHLCVLDENDPVSSFPPEFPLSSLSVHHARLFIDINQQWLSMSKCIWNFEFKSNSDTFKQFVFNIRTCLANS